MISHVAQQRQLRERGVTVSESVVRKWHGLYIRWAPEKKWCAIHDDHMMAPVGAKHYTTTTLLDAPAPDDRRK